MLNWLHNKAYITLQAALNLKQHYNCYFWANLEPKGFQTMRKTYLLPFNIYMSVL